jgi:hypothetical protein
VRSTVRLHVHEGDGCVVLTGLEFKSTCTGADRAAYDEGIRFVSKDLVPYR